MKFFSVAVVQKWGGLDVPLMGISTDWSGKPLNPPLGLSVLLDPERLWFLASRNAPFLTPENSKPDSFFSELWKYDVAELFLANPETGGYIELNLSPNGAWWAAKFNSPRVISPAQPEFSKFTEAHHQENDGNSWTSALSVSLDFLKAEIDFGNRTTANMTAILNSPDQTFHSAHELPGKEPDFHQPGSFPRFSMVDHPS